MDNGVSGCIWFCFVWKTEGGTNQGLIRIFCWRWLNENVYVELCLCGEARFISSYEAVGCKSLESTLFFFQKACCLSHSPGCSSLRFSGLNDTVGCLFSLTWLWVLRNLMLPKPLEICWSGGGIPQSSGLSLCCEFELHIFQSREFKQFIFFYKIKGERVCYWQLTDI